jgi:hypothetical protein
MLVNFAAVRIDIFARRTTRISSTFRYETECCLVS